jgi:hypothetical protein
MKTLCIYHRVDLDGKMSAAIVQKYFIDQKFCSVCEQTLHKNHAGSTQCCGGMTAATESDFIGWHYGDAIPDMSEYEQIIMVDISFPIDVMSTILETKQNFIWIDHHASMYNIIEHFDLAEIVSPKGIRSTQFAACELTWKYFFPDETMPDIVRLLGRYDCLTDAELAQKCDDHMQIKEFQYATKIIMDDYKKAYEILRVCLVNNVILDDIKATGRIVYEYLCSAAKQTYDSGFTIALKEQTSGFPNSVERVNRKFLCINQKRFNPANFGIDYHKDGYDGIACFWYENNKWQFSIYNANGKVDCSIIAKQYKGGGHTYAAGFIVDDISKFLQYHTKPNFCYAECEYLVPTEKEQDAQQAKMHHRCTKYNEHLKHGKFHPDIIRIPKCTYHNS